MLPAGAKRGEDVGWERVLLLGAAGDAHGSLRQGLLARLGPLLFSAEKKNNKRKEKIELG